MDIKNVTNMDIKNVTKNDKNMNWNEKYRPSNLEKIILSNYNKLLIKNILDKNYFPNLLLYGPPGTGKTTTVINLINSYLTKYYKDNKKQIIHLNASHERGIEIIRNNLYTFVVSDNLFFEGPKFIILDEVDYMTNSAQLALKYLIEYYSNYNVRYCLICNYITKIDNNLQNYFCKLKFNTIPFNEIHNFLTYIINNEKIQVSDECLKNIINTFKNDIRAMINYLQLSKDNIKHFITDDIYKNLYIINNSRSYEYFKKSFLSLELKHKFNYSEFIKLYLHSILKNNICTIDNKVINKMEFFINNYNKLYDKNIIIYNLYYLFKNDDGLSLS
jgi:DNA polymerase III delta prime subunit